MPQISLFLDDLIRERKVLAPSQSQQEQSSFYVTQSGQMKAVSFTAYGAAGVLLTCLKHDFNVYKTC